MDLEINTKISAGNAPHQIIPYLTSVINNITKLTLPVLVTIALSYIPKTNAVNAAGSAGYNFCILTCPSLIFYLKSIISPAWLPEVTCESAIKICKATCQYFSLTF